MKRSTTVSSALAVALLVLSACGSNSGSGSNEYTDQQRRDAKVLQDRFDSVRGTYEGTISNPAAGLEPLKAKLIVYTVNVREGANPDGSVRIRPALYGRFQLVDAVSATDYTSLTGDYDELGALSLTSISSTSGAGTTGTTGDAVALSVKGTVAGGEANVSVTRNGGDWGQFKGTRTTFDASAPSTSDSANYRDRLLALYTQLEGTYVGIVDNGTDRIKVGLTVTTGEDSSGQPTLVAQYRRFDLPTGVGELQLSVTYDSTTHRVTMLAVPGGGSPSIPGSGYLAGSGTWANGILDVALRDRKGSMGTLHSNRQPLN